MTDFRLAARLAPGLRTATSFPGRIAIYFAAVFLIYGVHISYLPVWLEARGLGPEQIGLLIALPIVLRVVLTPWIAAYADRTGSHRTLVVWMSVAGLVLLLAVWASPSYGWLLVTVVPFSIVVVSVLPLTDAIAVAGVRAAGHDYGRMRLWGSLTFLIATLVAGAATDAYGTAAIMWVLTAACATTAVAALMLPQAPAYTVPASEQETARGRPDRGIVRTLMLEPQFVAFILAVGLIQGSHAAFYTFGALHLGAQGVSGTAFGTLWAVSIVAEMALFAWSAPYVARVGPTALLALGGGAAILRWATMSLDPSYGVVLGLQALHALTYGATHLGAIHFIARAVPGRGAGTAQALYSAIGNGLMTALATYLAGQVYPRLAGDTFLVMGAVALAGTAAAAYLHATWDRRPLVP